MLQQLEDYEVILNYNNVLVSAPFTKLNAALKLIFLVSFSTRQIMTLRWHLEFISFFQPFLPPQLVNYCSLVSGLTFLNYLSIVVF